MDSISRSARASVKSVLKWAGLLPAARRVVDVFGGSAPRLDYELRFEQFKRKYAHVLGERLTKNNGRQRIALVCSPDVPEVEIELGLIKGLELNNCVPVVLIPHQGRRGKVCSQYYNLAAVDEIHLWSEFVDEIDPAIAEAVIDRYKSVEGLLEFEHRGVRVGRFAVSSALRSTYRGSLELSSTRDRQLLVSSLASGIAYADAAYKIVETFCPDLAVFVDTVYSPTGELFDCCLQKGIDTIQWQAGHKSNSVVFKRYSLESRLQHPRSLSEKSWNLVRNMEWGEAHRAQLDREFYRSYASGEWYSVVGTQFHKSMVDVSSLRRRFGLDPEKKTAFIFPHILWDATLFWGEGLFRNYEEWLVETVRAACKNDHVNWAIKIHPANRRVRESGSVRSEAAELVSLRKYIGELPRHIALIPPENEISTYSFFPLMDYCLTICGTVGIEASRLGIPVVTGGSGLYDRKGFTVDSSSREEYLAKLANIQAIPRLSSSQRELAERFAYGTFLMRPWHSKSVTLQYLQNTKKFFSHGSVNIKSADGWYVAEDLRAFADWVADPEKPEDFLASDVQTRPLVEK